MRNQHFLPKKVTKESSHNHIIRIRRFQIIYKVGVADIFTKFTQKHLGLVYNKVNFSLILLIYVQSWWRGIFQYFMLTIQTNLFVLYKIKKAYCKSFYTYIWVPEYVPELFFSKLHKENIGKSVFLQKQITTSFRTLTLKKLYFLYVTYTHTQFVNPSIKPGLIYMSVQLDLHWRISSG